MKHFSLGRAIALLLRSRNAAHASARYAPGCARSLAPRSGPAFTFKARILILGILALALGSAPVHAARLVKPNFVFILVDDLGYSDLGCYGSKFYRTPNLNRLAAQGMRFTEAYAAAPVCSPSRASILTGKYPARLHLTDWLPGRPDRPDQRLARPALRQELPLEEVTLAEKLKAAGYVTAHIGKWHLGGVGFEPERQGFDINIAGDVTGTPLSYFAPFKGKGRDGEERFMPGLETAKEGEYLTDWLTTEAERVIEKNRDKPFFLYFAHYAVHTPLKAKPDYVARYPTVTNTAGQQTNAIYAAMIESMDESVGRILRKLDELKLTEQTVVIFTSDNGGLATREGPNTPATINSPLREGKGWLYEGGLRVPLLAQWPGVIPPGSTNATPVSSVDYFPTLLELAGLRAGTEETRDGVSLVPLLNQTGELPARPLFWHYPHYANQGGKPGGVIREGDFKLIEFYETGRRELFDLRRDFRENQNLAEEPAQADRVKLLAAKLAAWRQECGAQMMTPNPSYAPSPQAADGTITLLAKDADVHGVTLRYEPLPHKNTLGFWINPTDWAHWEFEVARPGRFKVEITYGCGNGSGGSEVEFAVGAQKLMFQVEATGGFQSFVKRTIGELQLDQPGRHVLTVKARSKPGPAVMDLPQVRLKPLN